MYKISTLILSDYKAILRFLFREFLIAITIIV